MFTFRITYRPFGQSRERAAVVVDAASLHDALKGLGRVHSIVNTTMRCVGRLPNGDQCKRFSVHDTCRHHSAQGL